jgi:hypothetical protein
MKNKATQIALHSVRNLLGEQSQLDLFSNHAESFSNEYNIPLNGKIDRFGVDLTDLQSRVMEGILHGFNEMRYKGNLEAQSSTPFCQNKYSGKIPPAYKYISNIPVLKATQSQILEWAGINKNSIASWARAVEAIKELGTKQYCFYYDRLVFDENKKPLKDKNGRWVKEEVYTVDTLFTIKEIRNNDIIDYYEIIPSSIFLDQRESYFMFVPYNWREEVKSLVGDKKASSYTFRFLFYLRYQYEIFRRRNKEKPYIIKIAPQDIAISIKMPESVYRRQSKRTEQILLDAYNVAKKLGYLISFERKEVDILVLNDNKFFNNSDLNLNEAVEAITDEKQDSNSSEEQLLNLFYILREELDKHIALPSKAERKDQLEVFKQLLINRPRSDIENALKWSINKRFWASFTTTPADFRKNFEKIWADLTTAKQSSKEGRFEENKKFSNTLLGKYEGVGLNGVQVCLLNKHLEIGNGVHMSIIVYEELQFKDLLRDALSKWKISDLVKSK